MVRQEANLLEARGLVALLAVALIWSGTQCAALCNVEPPASLVIIVMFRATLAQLLAAFSPSKLIWFQASLRWISRQSPPR
jgi:hypothetical protein